MCSYPIQTQSFFRKTLLIRNKPTIISHPSTDTFAANPILSLQDVFHLFGCPSLKATSATA